MTNSGFQFGTRIGIHQIFHILGFSWRHHIEWNKYDNFKSHGGHIFLNTPILKAKVK